MRYWSKRLGSNDRAVSRTAIARMIDAGDDAVPVLSALLASPGESVRTRAAATLSRIGPSVLPHIVARLRHSEPDTRYRAVAVLRNLGRDAADAVPHLVRLLDDEDPAVSMEAGRALATMGDLAAPAVPRLARVLSHRYLFTRVMAAGALASIGPAAAPATPRLIRALDDRNSTVRRCAADALGSIGVAASSAVERLVSALRDPDRHVRICAAGALGRIGTAADIAVPALRRALDDPPLRSEAAWAIEQLTGERPTQPLPSTGHPPATPTPTPSSEGRTHVVRRPPQPPRGWPMLAGSPTRNNVSPTPVPTTWNLRGGQNIRWAARLGNETYGAPVIAGGVVFVGTSNEKPRHRRHQGKRGVLMAFRAKDGKLLWQDASPKPRNHRQSLLLPVTSSSPLVDEGERLYYITGEGQLRCLDTQGFRDDENDGPIVDEEGTTKIDADLIWELDLSSELGVFIHEAPNCSVAAAGDLLMVCTSNGVDEAHTNIPAPRAPSFIGVEKHSGAVAWQVVGPSPRVLHGQWSSPSIADVKGRTLAFFGGGDGWLYALEAATGREIWRFDGNDKNAIWRMSGDRDDVVLRNNIIACPVIHEDTVYLAMGQDPMHGQGRGRLVAIDPRGQGDVTNRRLVWDYRDVGRMIATPVIHGDLLFTADYNGFVHCVELDTGRRVWRRDILAGVWGGLIVAGQHVYVGDEDGTVRVFGADRTGTEVGAMELDSPIWSVPAAVDGTLYISTARALYAIGR